MNSKKIRNDIILIAVIIALIIVCAIFMRPTKSGSYVAILINGNQTAKYSLNEDFETDIITNGTNHLIIKNGEAYISHADCKTNVCVKTGKISRVGESIVCLPHNLIIEIISE